MRARVALYSPKLQLCAHRGKQLFRKTSAIAKTAIFHRVNLTLSFRRQKKAAIKCEK